MTKPKVRHGYDFDGNRIASVTFNLKSPDFEKQIEEFFDEHFPDDDSPGEGLKSLESGE